jgi:hypothetical protein
MKKLLLLPAVCICLSGALFGQKLTKKDSRKILETVLNCVKTSDTSGFMNMWILDKEQWPYHTQPYDKHQILLNYWSFKSFFDSALTKNLKIDQVDCDTVEYNDPHRGFSQYHITAWFNYSTSYRKGFGFYMDFIDNKWLIRFSPDYFSGPVPKAVSKSVPKKK